MIFFSYKSSLIFRESWGSHLKCIFFLLGHSHNQSVNELAKTEVALNDDIIQIQMIDEYHHLTQKVERTEILTVESKDLSVNQGPFSVEPSRTLDVQPCLPLRRRRHRDQHRLPQ